jgi:hypothetical protein
MTRPACIFAATLLACTWARAQAVDPALPATAPAAPAPQREPEEPWALSLAVSTYLVANERSYVQPTLTADRGWLHLEGRYNYEALDTASVWVGYNFAGGDEEKLTWELTPMVGGVFGDARGVAPGYRGSLAWRKLHLFTEGEYVFDTDDSADSFFYSWSELTVWPVDWLQVGLAAQRTRTDDADHDFQPGLVAGVSFERLALSAYVFDSHEGKPTWVFALSLSL